MLEWLNLYRADVQHIASLALGLAIWRYGAAPERAVGAVFVGIVIFPSMLARVIGFDHWMFGDQGWLYVLSDSFAVVGFLVIALNANRNYPMWIAGFQLVAMSAHVVRGMVDVVSPMAYAILAIGPSYCQLLLLLSGFTRHCLRRRRFGSYRDWRPSLPGSGWLGLSYPNRGPHV
jgi:hypothetical protein